MSSNVRTESETAPSESDVEELYDKLFGTPALDALKEEDEPEPMDEAKSFARVYKVARERPWVALRAIYVGVAAHFRGEDPFDYSIGDTRTSGEVDQ